MILGLPCVPEPIRWSLTAVWPGRVVMEASLARLEGPAQQDCLLCGSRIPQKEPAEG